MSGEHLTGFFGKIPAAGDFVSRGLTPAFVRSWDRFVSAHLARPLSVEPLEAHPTLRFASEAAAGGPAAGVVMASTDSAGRCFPLTLAATVPVAAPDLATRASDWFDAVAEAGDAARCGEIDLDGLERLLHALPFPELAPSEAEPCPMAFWLDHSVPIPIDPEAPASMLAQLLSKGREMA